jgi:integrase
MASVVTLGRKTGKRRKQYPRAIDFVWPKGVERPEGVGRRPRIYLGVMSREDADTVRGWVESLISCRALNQSPRPELAAWLSGISDDLYGKLAALGLTDARESRPGHGTVRLRRVCARFLWHKRSEVKPRTLVLYRQTIRRLVRYFPDNPSVKELTPAEAADWRAALKSREGLGEATVRQQCRNAKAVFNAAVEVELIPSNPFRKLTSRSIAAKRDHYIDDLTAERVLAELPDAQWRLLFGLARYAGLRVASESHRLTWEDIDRNAGQMRVYAPKTDSVRRVPISPRLERLIQDAWDAATEGEARVVTLSENNLHRTIKAAIRRAGLEVWPDLLQALRRSCETQWANSGVPQHAVSAWIGHSERVSRDFYLQVTDDLYALVTNPRTEAVAQQKTQQHTGARSGTELHRASGDGRVGNANRPGAGECGPTRTRAGSETRPLADYESSALTAELRGLCGRV